MVQTTNTGGGCLCGAVRYEIEGRLRKVVYCHCEQCRRTSGHYVAATACDIEQLTITKDDGLAWYDSSESARRGFCNICGASLFWAPSHGKYMAIMAGALDVPTGIASREHIYVDDKSDYYTLDDGLPTFPQDHPDLWEEDGA